MDIELSVKAGVDKLWLAYAFQVVLSSDSQSMVIWVYLQNLVPEIINGYVGDLLFAAELHPRVATISWSFFSPEWKTNVFYIPTTYQLISTTPIIIVGA